MILIMLLIDINVMIFIDIPVYISHVEPWFQTGIPRLDDFEGFRYRRRVQSSRNKDCYDLGNFCELGSIVYVEISTLVSLC